LTKMQLLQWHGKCSLLVSNAMKVTSRNIDVGLITKVIDGDWEDFSNFYVYWTLGFVAMTWWTKSYGTNSIIVKIPLLTTVLLLTVCLNATAVVKETFKLLSFIIIICWCLLVLIWKRLVKWLMDVVNSKRNEKRC